MNTATLSSKFQISVPKKVREALGLKPGQKLAFINTGTGMRLVPQPTVAEMVGILRGANTERVRDRNERPLALEFKLASVVAQIYATAPQHGATLVTCDARFEVLPGVDYRAKLAA